eukprot:jgi/Botrbrau1/1446/Bobra.178_3s0004.1
MAPLKASNLQASVQLGAANCYRRSGCGKQVLSYKHSFPEYTFGIDSRSSKVSLTPEQEKISPGNNSPGPIYNYGSSLGEQLEAHSTNAPAIGFSKEARLPQTSSSTPGPGCYKPPISLGPQALSSKPNFPTAVIPTGTRNGQHEGSWLTSPGPGSYQVPSGHGSQCVSQRVNPSAVGFPRAGRFKDAGPCITDAEVGSYNTPSASCGPQITSRSTSAPSFGFGTSTRDGLQKVYASKQHDRVAGGGKIGPGPITAGQRSGFGSQSASKANTSPAFMFGTATRLPVDWRHAETPGPGSHNT